jgi:hypothetical protein
MDKLGSIEIHISGLKGNLELSSDNFDIRETMVLLENVESLLFPGDKRIRPTISYKVEEGSVRHIFKTAIQFVIGFNAIIGHVAISQSIDFLDLKTAQAFETLQQIAKNKNYTIVINTSIDNTNKVKIDPSSNILRTEAVWVDAEFYLYGKITNAGGKEKANIHVATEEHGSLVINVPMSFLEAYDNNMLYKKYGVRVLGRQHSETGELDTSSLQFVEIVDYRPRYDEQYLNTLIDKATRSWSGIKDKNTWLRQIRDYEA